MQKTNLIDSINRAKELIKSIIIPEIKDQVSLSLAANERMKVKKALKQIDIIKKSETDPYNDEIKKIRADFKPIEETVDLYISQLDKRITDYNNEQSRLMQIEEDRLRKEQEKEAERLRKRAEKAKKPETVERLQEEAGLVEATPAIVLPPKKIEGMHFMEIFDFEIEDEALIPDEYKMIDTVKIRKVVKATKGTLPIKGIKIVFKKVPVSKN